MKKVILLLLFACGLRASAQVQMQFNPMTDGLSLDRLEDVRIRSTYPGAYMATLRITVTGPGTGPVVKVITPPFAIRNGINFVPPQAFSGSSFTFQQSEAGFHLSQTHKFPDGEYEYCFELTLLGNENVTSYFENCFDYVVHMTTPLLLLDPYDGEKTCDRRPNLLWQPSLPVQPGMTYTVVLMQELPGQTKTEAINFDQALLFVPNVPANTLYYPSTAPQLNLGQKYAWQVWGVQDGTIITKSEIWEFTVDCSQDTTSPSKDSYRELTDRLDADSYIAKGSIHFSFYNAYGPYTMTYGITDLSKHGVAIKHLPELHCSSGFNKFDLDLSGIGGFTSGDQYLVQVKPLEGPVLLLRFVYQE